MPSLRANHRQIVAAQAIGAKRTRYRIEGVEGLWLDVGPTGRRAWYVRYQIGPRQRRTFRWYKIGDASAVPLAKAIDRAREVLTEVHLAGQDPCAKKGLQLNSDPTFANLFENWFDRHAKPKLARADLDQCIFDKHLKDKFGRMRASELRRTDIGALRDRLVGSSGPIGSNNVLVLINRVLNWSVDEGLIELNPASRLRKAGVSRPRERVLSEDEIRSFWSALSAMETLTGEHMGRGEAGRMLTPATRSVLRLLLLTGQRRSEVACAEKAEFSLAGTSPVWTIPGSRTKNGLLHRVPLSSMAAVEFSKAIAESPASSAYVFPTSKAGEDASLLPSTITRAMKRMTDELNITGVSPHDLRRTVGTEMARLGLPAHIRSLVLNHSPQSRGVTDAVYNRYAYDQEKKDAFDLWEGHLKRLLGLSSGPPTAGTPPKKPSRTRRLLELQALRKSQ